MTHSLIGLASLAFICLATSANAGRGKPDAPPSPPSRFNYELHIDPKSLPPGVTLKPRIAPTTFWISNASAAPLIVNEIYMGDRLLMGAKLVSGKVFHYFESGIPQEGKQHLKGWQCLSDELTSEGISVTSAEPAVITASRKPGVDKTLPPSEPFSFTVKYDGKAHVIRGTVTYQLNPAYDAPSPAIEQR